MPRNYGDSSSPISASGSTATSGWTASQFISLSDALTISVDSNKKTGYNPRIVFKLIKKKLGILEKMKLTNRLKRLEKAFYAAVDNGQDMLAQKMLNIISRETKESRIYARGIKHFIERDVINQYKHKIRGGHLADTRFEEFTRVIPKDVLAKKKACEDLFDGFIIYHYWSEQAKDVKTMEPEERSRMKDPILFGTIKETSRLYFIADWEDELCDLTFDELVDALGEDGETMLNHKPTLE